MKEQQQKLVNESMDSRQDSYQSSFNDTAVQSQHRLNPLDDPETPRMAPHVTFLARDRDPKSDRKPNQ